MNQSCLWHSCIALHLKTDLELPWPHLGKSKLDAMVFQIYTCLLVLSCFSGRELLAPTAAEWITQA